MRDLSFDILARDRTRPAFDSAQGNARAFGTSLQAMDRHMSVLAASAKAFAAGFVIGGAAELVGHLRSAVAEAAKLDDTSRKIGIPVEDIQKLTFGLTQAGVEADAVDGILTKWSKSIGEAYTKGGQLADIFKANGVSLVDSNGKLRSSVDLMRDYADLVKNAGSDQERVVLATLGFGRAGASMVGALKDGTSGFEDLMHAADEAGGVIDKDLIARAAVLDDKIEAVGHTVETNLRGAMLRTADAIDTIITKTGDLGNALSQAGNSDFFTRLNTWLGVTDKDGKVMAGSGLLLPPPGGNFSPESYNKEREDLQRRIKDLTDVQNELATSGDKEQAEAIRQQIELRHEELALIERKIAALQQASTNSDILKRFGKTDSSGYDRPALGGRETVIPSGKDKDPVDPWEDLRNVDSERKRVVDMIVELQKENALIGASAQAKRAARAERLAGAAATEDERKQIVALSEALYQEEQAQQRASKANAEGRQDFEDTYDIIKQGVIEHRKFWEITGDIALSVLDKIARKAEDSFLDMAFPSNGGTNIWQSLFGSIFGSRSSNTSSAKTAATPITTALMTAPVIPVTRAPLADVGGIEAYIRQAAQLRNIDPDIAVRVAQSEGGLKSWNLQSGFVKNGVREPSFGPYQLYKGGGLGNAFQRETGMDPANASSGPAGVDFALDHAAKNGWGAWYGAARVGVGKWEGIGNNAKEVPIAFDSLTKSAKGVSAAVDKITTNSVAAADGLAGLGGGLQNMAKSLMSIGGGAGGSGWFSGLMSMFGGAGGALKHMNAISPRATSFIAGGGVGLFASGTESAPAGWAWVGEEGPELMRMKGGEKILNNRLSNIAASGGGGGGATQVDVRAYVDQDGNWHAAVERVATQQATQITRAGISQYDKNLPDRFGDIMERNAG